MPEEYKSWQILRASFDGPGPTMSTTLLFHFVSALCCISVALGGICWSRQGRNGRCKGSLLRRMVSEEQCCSGSQPGLAWSSEDLTDTQISYYIIIDRGVPECQSCRNSCEGIRCLDGYKCKEGKHRSRCVCSPDCSQLKRPLRRRPVCGIDARTYRNYCSMLKHNCRNTESIVIDYLGPCKGSCSDVKCEPGKRCMTDQNGTPHCIPCTPKTCVAEQESSKHVCGTDLITYPSICHFRQAKCLLSELYNLTVSHHGPCQGSNKTVSCGNQTCTEGQKCLTDQRNGHRTCVACSGYCENQSEQQVCGSDGKTHINHCQMHQFSCSSGVIIYSQALHLCQAAYTEEDTSLESNGGDD